MPHPRTGDDGHPDVGAGGVADDARPGTWAMVAALVVGLQGLVVVAFAVYYLAEYAKAYSIFNVLVSAGLFLLSGAGLLLVAKGLVDGRGWARSPALTWEIVCLPVAWGLLQAGRWYLGVPIGLLSVLALVGLIVGVAPNRR